MNVLKWLSGKATPTASSSSIFVGNGFYDVPDNVKAFAKEGYAENPVVFACASIIAAAAASVKLEVHSYNGSDKTVDVTSKLLDLLANPNPMQSWGDFCNELISWHRIAGEFFILRLPEKGPTKELYILSPDMMQVVEPKQGSLPKEYVYGSGENKRVFPVNIVTGESQVLHVKTFNPLNRWRGLSPLSPAAAR